MLSKCTVGKILRAILCNALVSFLVLSNYQEKSLNTVLLVGPEMRWYGTQNNGFYGSKNGEICEGS